MPSPSIASPSCYLVSALAACAAKVGAALLFGFGSPPALELGQTASSLLADSTSTNSGVGLRKLVLALTTGNISGGPAQ
jgi:hypothetical protein